MSDLWLLLLLLHGDSRKKHLLILRSVPSKFATGLVLKGYAITLFNIFTWALTKLFACSLFLVFGSFFIEGKVATITGFDIQGRSSSNQYIKKFTMSYKATKHVGFRDYSEVCCDHVFLKTVKRRDLKKLHDVVGIYRNLTEVPKMFHFLSQEVELAWAPTWKSRWKHYNS